jgi:hypothetical protein
MEQLILFKLQESIIMETPKITSIEITQALERDLLKKILEERMFEHPSKALDRTEFIYYKSESRLRH